MKNIPYLIVALLCPLFMSGQNLEVEGEIIADSIDVSSGLIKNVSDPVDAQDAATKAYVDILQNEIEMLQKSLFEIEYSLGKDSISDITGNFYEVGRYGSQFWFNENLRTTKYNDGSAIDGANSTLSWTANPTNGKWSWYNGDSATYEIPSGKMYNWYAVDSLSNGDKNICPSDWHVATLNDMNLLRDYLTENGFGFDGSGNDIAKSMASTSGWSVNNGAAGNVGNDQASNNSSGFTGHPGGLRGANGASSNSGTQVFWWTSTSFDGTLAYNFGLTNGQSIINDALNPNGVGHYVRCVKD